MHRQVALGLDLDVADPLLASSAAFQVNQRPVSFSRREISHTMAL
jgi:hypothetical protein